MTDKEKYGHFCECNYVPIYSQPWWMDAVCGEQNWDVWLHGNNGDIDAAMPYYMETRRGYKYITKAPLTQNNGIIFKENDTRKRIAQAKFEEKIINAACEYIDSLQLDVYEQQYQTTFTNWLPFYWNNYAATIRYTYQIEDLSDMENVWNNFNSNRRNKIKKGRRNCSIVETEDLRLFYNEHEKIFEKQSLKCPFSYELWKRLVNACWKNKSGKLMIAMTKDNKPASLSFTVWDQRKLYRLVGGSIPEFQYLNTHSAITWEEMVLAHNMELVYDFEGSVIKRIAKANLEYGAIPKPYFRIRKVFNPDIIREEAESSIGKLMSKGE